MNNMGFFNPFGSSSSGGGGGGGSTANYSVKTFTDSSGQISYKLTKNGTAVGDVISFNGSNMLVNYGGELVVLNSAIAGIEEALDKTYNFTTFTELGIDTQNKTLSQLSTELVAKNLEEGTVVTGRVYSEALPYNNYGNAEVLVNNSILWWKTSSSTISPYSWNAIVAGNTVKMDWAPTYYQLPIASAQSLGGVKIGDNVQIAPDGTISVITTKGDTGTGIASIVKTSSSGLNDIYTITYTDSTTSTFTVTNGATITGGSIGQTGHLILTMSDGRTIDAGALPTDNEVEVTTTSSQPADPNVELWVDLSTQQTLSIPEINDSSTSSTQDTWSCKKIYDEQQKQEEEIGAVANAGAKNLLSDKHAVGNAVETNGFRFTPQSDGGIKIESIGTHSANGDYYLQGSWGNTTTVLDLSDDTYAATASCETTVSGISLRIYGASSTPIVNNLYLNNEINLTGEVKFIFITVISTAVIPSGGIIVYPMIRHASITDSTFVPYAKTNRELTVAEAEDRAAMAALIDGGAKNLVNAPSGSGIRFINIPIVLQPGDYYVKFQNITSTDTGASVCQFGAFAEDNSQASSLPQLKREDNTGAMFTVTKQTSYVRLYASSSFAGGEGDTVTFTGCMICTAKDYAVSPAFVPYRPSWQEMWEMIQALQNNS